MDTEYYTVVFDIEELVTGQLWEHMLTLASPDDLFYAVWANFYHCDGFFLDVIFENAVTEDTSITDEQLCQWIDMFFEQFESLIDDLRAVKAYNLHSCRTDIKTHSLYVIFKAREFDEPFTAG